MFSGESSSILIFTSLYFERLFLKSKKIRFVAFHWHLQGGARDAAPLCLSVCLLLHDADESDGECG